MSGGFFYKSGSIDVINLCKHLIVSKATKTSPKSGVEAKHPFKGKNQLKSLKPRANHKANNNSK